MARPLFSPEEHNPTGRFYDSGTLTSFLGIEMPPEPVLNRPISPKENWRLLFDGKKPYWIPACGVMTPDVNMFRPRINGDNIANHQVFDGGPPFPYKDNGGVAKSDWFDIEWQFDGDIGGATVRPGNPKVTDITRWEKYVQMPDLDSMDWKTCAEQNVKYLDTNKMSQLGIQCGLFERLMALMDVAEACIALCDEKQKPSVHRFLDQYADFLIGYIGRMADVCNIDCVLIHEDWAHQRGPFMSPDMAREMLLPYSKRIVDYVHSRGMSYEIHCCGACELLVPVFIETGADIWFGQPRLNDMGGYAKKYKGSQLVFGVLAPELKPDASDEDVRIAASEWVDEFKDCRVACSNMRPFDEMDKPINMGIFPAIYEFSRIAYQNED